ncbi:MAG: DUF6599 family protein [bacterium]
MKTLFPWVLLQVMACSIFASTINPVLPADFPLALISRTDTISQEALWSYNPGNAPLIMEYGFRSMVVQEFSFDNERIKAEIIQLDSPESAFGLYSLSAMNCSRRDTAGPYDCLNTLDYKFAYGDLFVTVSSESGSLQAVKLYFAVAKVIRQRNLQNTLALPDPFGTTRLKAARGNLIFTEGQIGMQNCLIPWKELFYGVRFAMFAIYVSDMENDLYFGRISFQTPTDQSRFLSAAGLMRGVDPIPNTNTNNNRYREYRQVDDKTIWFLQSQEPYSIDGLLYGAR